MLGIEYPLLQLGHQDIAFEVARIREKIRRGVIVLRFVRDAQGLIKNQWRITQDIAAPANDITRLVIWNAVPVLVSVLLVL